MNKNIALIGAGSWGKNHLKNLNQLGVLHTVLEQSAEMISKLQREFPHISFTQDERKIINNPEIKGVVIAVPAGLHFKLSKKFLMNNKDVMVEKPLALTVKEGSELVALAEKKNLILMVGHILQFHPAVIKLKELINNGELGNIRYLYSNRLNIGKLRTEENVLWSFAPHDISLILMLRSGEEPKRVLAYGGAYINQNIYDTTLTVLEFKNGVRGHIFVSWLHPYKEQKLVVVGSDKMAVFDDLNKEKLFIYPHKIEWSNGKIPIAHKADFLSVDCEMKQPLREELLHFLDCIHSRKIPKTNGKEGLQVLKILEKAEKSLIRNLTKT